MTRRHGLLFVVVALVAVALATGTGALSSSRLGRGVTAQVADDQHAQLGVVASDVTVSGAATDVALLTLVNRRAVTLTDVNVTVREANTTAPPALSNVTSIDGLAPGEAGTVMADVACGATTNSERVDIDVVASGPGIEIDLSRGVQVDCR